MTGKLIAFLPTACRPVRMQLEKTNEAKNCRQQQQQQQRQEENLSLDLAETHPGHKKKQTSTPLYKSWSPFFQLLPVFMLFKNLSTHKDRERIKCRMDDRQEESLFQISFFSFL